MIKYYFQDYLIKDNEIMFYIYIGIMLLIIISAFVIGYKETKKNVNK